MADADLTAPIYPLFCPECREVSHKALGELLVRDRLPCDHCRKSIIVAREYGHARLTEILESLGRSGSIVPQLKEGE
jgi:hypothetical protein